MCISYNLGIISYESDSKTHSLFLEGTQCLIKNNIFKTLHIYLEIFPSICQGNSFVFVQLLSHVQLFVTPWTAVCQASLSFTISQSLLKLMSTVSMIPSNHLIIFHTFLLLSSIFPSISVNELALWIRCPKYWSFSFSISPSSEYSGLISFRTDCLIFLLSKGPLRVFSSNIAQNHQFFSTQPSNLVCAETFFVCKIQCF